VAEPRRSPVPMTSGFAPAKWAVTVMTSPRVRFDWACRSVPGSPAPCRRERGRVASVRVFTTRANQSHLSSLCRGAADRPGCRLAALRYPGSRACFSQHFFQCASAANGESGSTSARFGAGDERICMVGTALLCRAAIVAPAAITTAIFVAITELLPIACRLTLRLLRCLSRGVAATVGCRSR